MNETKQSWDFATRQHNAHKGDQARFFRDGGDVLFPEELALLGDLSGKALAHLQCNAGQDTLCLSRRGAAVTGVDFSSEAIRFAQQLSAESGIPGRFLEAELLSWLATTDDRFDLCFSSYGAVGWLPHLSAWARGIARVLRPSGRFVYVEFHPLVWSVGADFRLAKDDYFHRGPYRDPVSDYVAEAGPSLAAVDPRPGEANPHAAESFQYGLGEIVSALVDAGLVLETLREYPHANGARVIPTLVPSEGRRWVFPEGVARVPLMFGLSVRRP